MKNRNTLFTTIVFVLACFALSPRAQAVFPAPDGGYPGDNTAEGTNALLSRTTGIQNTALGFNSLLNLTVGNNNTGVGLCTLVHDISGVQNVATGAFSLFNTNGSNNVGNGYQTLYNNVAGSNNTAIGFRAGFNTNSNFNVANGYQALYSNVAGSTNTAIGFRAGYNITNNGNVCIGAGVLGVAGEINTTRIKNVYGSVAGARAVYVNAYNKIGTLASSRRYKEEIKPMDKASETLFGLKPVTFRYKKEVDPAHALSFGLIAEEVAEISPDLITRDEDGEPQTVRYEAVNAMFLNEFLKEHRTVQRQQKEIDALKAELKEQKALIQKVSDKMELIRPAPQVANNNH
jgi:Chaperone of endosialidase